MSVSGYDNNYVLRETDGASAVGNSNSSKRLLTKWYLENNPSIFCGSSKWLEYVGSSTNGDLCLRAGNCQVNSYTNVTTRFDGTSSNPGAPTETDVTVFGMYTTGTSHTISSSWKYSSRGTTHSGGAFYYSDQYGPIIYFSSGNTQTIIWGAVWELSPKVNFSAFPDANVTSNEVVGSGSFNWNGTKYILNNGYMGDGGTFAAWTTQNSIQGTHCNYNAIIWPFLLVLTPTSPNVSKSGNHCSVPFIMAATNSTTNTISPMYITSSIFGSSGNYNYSECPNVGASQYQTSKQWFCDNSVVMDAHYGTGSSLALNMNYYSSRCVIPFYNVISFSNWSAMALSSGFCSSYIKVSGNNSSWGLSCKALLYIGGVHVKRNEPNWNRHNGHKIIYMNYNDHGDYFPKIGRMVSIYNAADSTYYDPNDTLEY